MLSSSSVKLKVSTMLKKTTPEHDMDPRFYFLQLFLYIWLYVSHCIYLFLYKYVFIHKQGTQKSIPTRQTQYKIQLTPSMNSIFQFKSFSCII